MKTLASKNRGGQSLIADLIKARVTGVKGYCDEPFLLAIASPTILFDRYTRGWVARAMPPSSTRGIVTISLEIRTMTQKLIRNMFGRSTFCSSALVSVGINTNDFLGDGDPFWISQRISNHLRNAFAATPRIATIVRT